MICLGIDIGSSNVKVIALDVEEKRILGKVSYSYSTIFPKPRWAEQRPEDWWIATTKAVRTLLDKYRVESSHIKGIGVSSQREGIVLIDPHGKPLANCIIWMDRRSEKEARDIKNILGEKNIYRKTGLRVDATFTATKLLWIKRNMPEVLRKARVVLQPKDYIVFKLTDNLVTDYSLASRTMLFDISKLEWIDEFFHTLGLENMFPETLWSIDYAGSLTRKAAEKLGLPAGIPVAAGSGDRPAESIGAGATKPGIVVESTGTTTNVNTPSFTPLFDSKMRSLVGVHIVKGLWLVELGLSMGASLFKWFTENYAVDLVETARVYRGSPYELLSEVASRVPPGAEGVIVMPFFMGARAPWWKMGIRGAVIGLTLGHTREHLVRALLEAIAYDIRSAIEVLRDLGLKISIVRSIGGASRNTAWLRIKADILGLRVDVPSIEDAAALADAIMGATAADIVKNPIDVLSNIEVSQTIYPIRENMYLYDKLYKEYKEIALKYFTLYEADEKEFSNYR